MQYTDKRQKKLRDRKIWSRQEATNQIGKTARHNPINPPHIHTQKKRYPNKLPGSLNPNKGYVKYRRDHH